MSIKTIQIKTTQEQFQVIRNLAQDEYLSVSALLRKLALDYAKSKQEVLTHQHENQRK